MAKTFLTKEQYDALRKCPNCGKEGPHFVPPSFGDEGFYFCDKPTEPPSESDAPR
jgi:hypothetical protein